MTNCKICGIEIKPLATNDDLFRYCPNCLEKECGGFCYSKEKGKAIIDLNCCGKPMFDLLIVDYLDRNTESIKRFVCGECGGHIDIKVYLLDDEELNYLKEYPEMENTKIVKELRTEDGE